MLKYDRWFLPDGEVHLPWWMDTANRIVEGRKTYQYHKYEAALAYCPTRRVGVDVGAHVGLFSYWMAKDFADLIAFEPKAAHRECWHHNMAGRGGTLIPAALGNHTGRVDLWTGPDSSGNTYVDPARATGEVTLMTLDEFDLHDVDFLKIDAEGYEAFILEGARATLLRCRPVILVEQKPGHGKKYGISDTAGVEFLTTLGYRERRTLAGDVILTHVGGALSV